MNSNELNLWHHFFEYGEQQIRDLRQVFSEISAEVRSKPRQYEDVVPWVSWGSWYGYPSRLTAPLALASILAGVGGHAAVSGLLKYFAPKSASRAAELFAAQLVLPAAMSLNGNLRSWMIHHRSMHDLLRSATRSDLSSLSDAVRIDKGAITARQVRKLVAQAELAGDAKFFSSLAEFMTYQPPPDEERELFELNAALYFLHVAGALDRLSKADAYELFAVRLKWYPQKTASKDSIGKKLQRFKKTMRQ